MEIKWRVEWRAGRDLAAKDFNDEPSAYAWFRSVKPDTNHAVMYRVRA